MIQPEQNYWSKFEAQQALEPPQVRFDFELSDEEAHLYRTLGFSLFSSAETGETLGDSLEALSRPVAGPTYREVTYLAADHSQLPSTHSEVFESYRNSFVFGTSHKVYRPNQGGWEDSFYLGRFAEAYELTAIRSLACMGVGAPPYIDFSMTHLALLAEDEERVLRLLLVDVSLEQVRKRVQLPLLAAGERPLAIQYLSWNSTTGLLEGVLLTSRRILRFAKTAWRSIVEIESGDVLLTMNLITGLGFHLDLLNWSPVSAQADLGTYLGYSEHRGKAYRISYDTGQPGNVLLETTYDLRSVNHGLSNLFEIGPASSRQIVLAYSGRLRGFSHSTLTPTSSSFISERRTGVLDPQSAIFVPAFTTDRPWQTVLCPVGHRADLVGVLGYRNESAAAALAELDLASYHLATLDGQDGWSVEAGAVSVSKDVGGLSLSGRVIHLEDGDRVRVSYPATLGGSLMARLRPDPANGTSAAGKGLKLRFGDANGSVTFRLNTTGLYGTSLLSGWEVVAGEVLDLKLSLRLEGWAYFGLLGQGFPSVVQGVILGTVPTHPTYLEVEVDDPGNSYLIEWMLVLSSCSDPLVQSHLDARVLDSANFSNLPQAGAWTGRSYDRLRGARGPNFGKDRKIAASMSDRMRTLDRLKALHLKDTDDPLPIEDSPTSIGRELVLREALPKPLGPAERLARLLGYLLDFVLDQADRGPSSRSLLRCAPKDVRHILHDNGVQAAPALGLDSFLFYRPDLLALLIAPQAAGSETAYHLQLAAFGFTLEPYPFSQFDRGRDHLDSGIPFDSSFFDNADTQYTAVHAFRVRDREGRVIPPADPRAKVVTGLLRSVAPFPVRVEYNELGRVAAEEDFESLVVGDLVGQGSWLSVGGATSPKVVESLYLRDSYAGSKAAQFGGALALPTKVRLAFAGIQNVITYISYRCLVRPTNRLPSSSGLLCELRGDNDGGTSLATFFSLSLTRSQFAWFSASGTRERSYGTNEQFLDPNRWHQVGIYLDLEAQRIDLFLDGMVLHRFAEPDFLTSTFDELRFQGEGEVGDSLLLDDLRVEYIPAV